MRISPVRPCSTRSPGGSVASARPPITSSVTTTAATASRRGPPAAGHGAPGASRAAAPEQARHRRVVEAESARAAGLEQLGRARRPPRARRRSARREPLVERAFRPGGRTRPAGRAPRGSRPRAPPTAPLRLGHPGDLAAAGQHPASRDRATGARHARRSRTRRPAGGARASLRTRPRATRRPPARWCAARRGQALGAQLADHRPGAQAVDRTRGEAAPPPRSRRPRGLGLEGRLAGIGRAWLRLGRRVGRYGRGHSGDRLRDDSQ